MDIFFYVLLALVAVMVIGIVVIVSSLKSRAATDGEVHEARQAGKLLSVMASSVGFAAFIVHHYVSDDGSLNSFLSYGILFVAIAVSLFWYWIFYQAFRTKAVQREADKEPYNETL